MNVVFIQNVLINLKAKSEDLLKTEDDQSYAGCASKCVGMTLRKEKAIIPKGT